MLEEHSEHFHAPGEETDAMNRSTRILGILCLIAAAGASGEALANCQNEGPYPVTQCATLMGTPSWFAPKPLDSGIVAATWWLLGSGNRPGFDTTNGVSTTPVDGDGFIDTPNPGIWIGNDAGLLTAGPATGDPMGGLDLIDAEYGTGTALAAGGLCFSASANWALPFVDGCSDQNRTYSVLGAGVDGSDNYINPYFAGATGGPGYLTDYALVDAPMAVLLTETTNKYFAAAFFSSTNRNGDPNDIFDKGYDMGSIFNGDNNPADPNGPDNIIPWQSIPQPLITGTIDPNLDRILAFDWNAVRIVRDSSSRINTGAMTDPIANLHVLGNIAGGGTMTGVGILEQPELVWYLPERKPIAGVDCDPNAAWVPAGPPVIQQLAVLPGAPLNTSVTVPRDTCVRLTTRFGRIPTATFQASPANIATRNANRFNAQAGNFGDVGYEVSSAEVKVGGNLLSDRPVLRSASWVQRRLVVRFETLGEIELESFDIVARDRRGGTSIVANVPCSECSSGIGAEYTVELPQEGLKAAKSIYVVAHPSETESNSLDIVRSTARPTPGRNNRR